MNKTENAGAAVALDTENKEIIIIDQTRLPTEEVFLRLRTQAEIREAIKTLRVRGAPAIGIAAAFGLYLAAEELRADSAERLMERLAPAADYLSDARPTAVNLRWALERMLRAALSRVERGTDAVREALLNEALAIRDEDENACRNIGEYALGLLKKGDGILTHCNAGSLATARYGTATAAMYLGHERGYGFRIFADETRPLLQGARLTAFELLRAGMDVTLICDNMAAFVMKEGLIDAVLVGCDRVARNGDAANKIGTLSVAVAAKRFGVPFYVCAPSSTIDGASKTGADIVIERRPPEEVTEMWFRKRSAPPGVKVLNPAFDVTESDLITAIITEYGVIYPPFENEIVGILRETR